MKNKATEVLTLDMSCFWFFFYRTWLSAIPNIAVIDDYPTFNNHQKEKWLPYDSFDFSQIRSGELTAT